jgi:serine-protein kinase ATM
VNITSREAQLLYAKVLRESLRISKDHESSQGSLRSAISLSKLAESSAAVGISIDAASRFDLANVLWDQGEMTTSIRMLQGLSDRNDLHKQVIAVSRAEILSSLVSHQMHFPGNS